MPRARGGFVDPTANRGRDVRCGGFHPGNDAITHEMVAKSVLGILGEQPRW